MSDVERIINFARQAHAGQLHGSLDYFEGKVCSVMLLVQSDYSKYGVSPQIALILNTTAILKDITKKTHKTFTDIFNVLQEAKYAPNEIDVIVRSLLLLTTSVYEKQDDYIENLLDDTCARFITKAESRFSLEELIVEGDYGSAKKYLKALCRINQWELEN